MKNCKYVLILMLSVVFSAVSYAQKPLIVCEKSSYDFGFIKEDGGLVTHTFVIKNVGKAPLVINEAKSSCGCTTPVWTKTPILPGKSGTIKVSFDPQGRPGAFTKTVNVFSNALKKSMTLLIRGTVIEKEKK